MNDTLVDDELWARVRPTRRPARGAFLVIVLVSVAVPVVAIAALAAGATVPRLASHSAGWTYDAATHAGQVDLDVSNGGRFPVVVTALRFVTSTGGEAAGITVLATTPTSIAPGTTATVHVSMTLDCGFDASGGTDPADSGAVAGVDATTTGTFPWHTVRISDLGPTLSDYCEPVGGSAG